MKMLSDSARDASGYAVLAVTGETAPAHVKVERSWEGSTLRCRIRNDGQYLVKVHELIALDLHHELPDDTPLLAEGFGMTNLTGGTVGRPLDLGEPDRMYERRTPRNVQVAYGMLQVGPDDAGQVELIGFAACRRFVGRFYISPGRIRVGFDCEDLTLAPGESWEMEPIVLLSGQDAGALQEQFAGLIADNHPRRRPQVDEPPRGWCSWYSVYAHVTADFVRRNLDVIAERFPHLRYIQIDDGYQPLMGDWLETGPAFGGDVRGVLREIRGRGFEPAIWIAPFVASAGSRLFREHRDWFVRDRSDDLVTSAVLWRDAWRQGPWFILDTSHPGACEYLGHVFGTMRHEWGVRYFKLDANSWGATAGRRHDRAATRVQAFRNGMRAIVNAVGDDAFVLGCNSPHWPSLGLIDGNRTSFDIGRDFRAFRITAGLYLRRNWQNGRLWWCDPDCVVLAGGASRNEVEFHATAVFCSGGLLLSGDDLTALPEEATEMLGRLLDLPWGVAAQFQDADLRVGRIRAGGRDFVAMLNWGSTPFDGRVALDRAVHVRDFWRGEDLGWFQGDLRLTVPERGVRLVELLSEPA